MSGTINKVTLIGNVGADPEVKRTQDGRPVVNLSIATSDTWKDKTTGERKEKTEWHRVVIFNEGLCKVAEQYVKKGAKLYLEGQLQTRKWTDKDGKDKFSTEVVLNGFNSNLTMLDKPAGENADRYNDFENQYSNASGRSARATAPGRATGDSLYDDIPF